MAAPTFRIADYTPADPVPDAVCPGCGFANFLYRETIREQVAGHTVEATYLVCRACYGRFSDETPGKPTR